jgi:hypothetical protein
LAWSTANARLPEGTAGWPSQTTSFTIAASALISGVQNLDRGNSLIGLPNSLLGAIKFPARLHREFRRNHLRNRTFFIGFSANFAANHEKFPAFSLLAGNLDPETGSPLTVSSAIHLPDMTVYFQFPRAPE